VKPLPPLALFAFSVACGGGGPHLSNLRCRDASQCTDAEDPLKLLLAVDFQDDSKTLSAGALELRVGGDTQRAIALADAFAAQGIAKDAARGTLAIDDDLVLDQLRNGQEVTVGFIATNGRREQSNEADMKFVVRLGPGQ